MGTKFGKLLVNKDICTGCRACEVVCSLKHEGAFWPEKARLQVYKKEEDGRDYPVVCRQCRNAACLEACPDGVLERDPRTGAILVGEGCTGCGSCVEACPWEAIRLDAEPIRPLICDLCGGEPACVERCVVHALRYRDTEGKIITAPVHAITLPLEKLGR